MKKDGLSDVATGAYGGAEVCGLVGTFLLDKISEKYYQNSIDLYHDNRLSLFKNKSDTQLERIKKNLQKTFKDFGLKILAEPNIRIVNYLDMTLNLNNGSFKPYHIPDDIIQYLKLLLQYFLKIKVLTASHTDKASVQYGEFLKIDMKLVNKDDEIDPLDDFFFTKLRVGKKYPELSKIVVITLTLKYGQADIARGFSENKTVLQQNIKEGSISSKRIIKDHMLANKLQPYSIEITNEMRKLVRAAKTRYAVYLEEEKEKNESLKTESARKVTDREIKEVWSKITEKTKTCQMLDEKSVLLFEEAEKKKDISLPV